MIEVFNEVSARQIQGIMLHAQFTDLFDYLNLHGLKRWHEYQYFAENAELRGIHRYAINHCNRLIKELPVTSPKMIPTSWETYTRMQVDASTRKTAVKEAFEHWYDWEKSTKEFYEGVFKQLTENAKIASANKINELICDVDQELKYLTRKMLEYKAVDYDMDYILFQQNELHEYFKEKTKELGVSIC